MQPLRLRLSASYTRRSLTVVHFPDFFFTFGHPPNASSAANVPALQFRCSILAGHSLQIVTLPARRRIRKKKKEEAADAWRISTVIRGCHSLRAAADRQQIKSVPTFDWTLPRRMRQTNLRIRPTAAPSLTGKKKAGKFELSNTGNQSVGLGSSVAKSGNIVPFSDEIRTQFHAGNCQFSARK